MRKRYHKFNATKTIRDGQTFHSKIEAEYYDFLSLLKRSGEVIFFLRQVPFHLPGNVTYRVDFQIFWEDNEITFIDIKGYETAEFITKKKIVESIYPIEIQVIKKGEFGFSKNKT